MVCLTALMIAVKTLWLTLDPFSIHCIAIPLFMVGGPSVLGFIPESVLLGFVHHLNWIGIIKL